MLAQARYRIAGAMLAGLLAAVAGLAVAQPAPGRRHSAQDDA
jgi:hypothetical protein